MTGDDLSVEAGRLLIPETLGYLLPGRFAEPVAQVGAPFENPDVGARYFIESRYSEL